MAQELVLMAKEKYDTLMKSCQNKKRNNDEKTSNVGNSFTRSDEVEACSEQTTPEFCDIIQCALPGKIQNKAKGLMQYLKQHGSDTIKWNRKGQIIVNDNVIKGSHLIDLLRDAVCPKTVKKICSI